MGKVLEPKHYLHEIYRKKKKEKEKIEFDYRINPSTAKAGKQRA